MTGGKNNIPINLKINKDLASIYEYPVGEKFVYIKYSFNIRIFSPFLKILFIILI